MGLKAARAKALNKEWANKTSSGMVQERTTVTRAILASWNGTRHHILLHCTVREQNRVFATGTELGTSEKNIRSLFLVGPSTRGRLRGGAEG